MVMLLKVEMEMGERNRQVSLVNRKGVLIAIVHVSSKGRGLGAGIVTIEYPAHVK